MALLEKAMIHPDTELRFINEKIGYGIVALRPIPKGTITWALDKLDRTFTPEQVGAMGHCQRGEWLCAPEYCSKISPSFLR